MLALAIGGIAVMAVLSALIEHWERDLDRRWAEVTYAWSAPERSWDEDWEWSE